MANVKKKGFKTIETNYEELDKQIRDHRKSILKRGLQIIALVVVLFVGIELIFALQSFDDYEVVTEMERKSSGSTQYKKFGE